MNQDFIQAVKEIEKEKKIPSEKIFNAVEAAMQTAYKKYIGMQERENRKNDAEQKIEKYDVHARIDRETGEIKLYTSREIVEQVTDDNKEISLKDARLFDESYEIGDKVEFDLGVDSADFSRFAAHSAKQVLGNQISVLERAIVYEEYYNRIGEVVVGRVTRMSKGNIFVGLGKAEGFLPVKEQMPGEVYNVEDRIRVYIMDVKKGSKGAQIFVSRSHPAMVAKIFEKEVPEIQDGIVEIKGIAREAGQRTKMAVVSHDKNIDPVGACVGNRGMRVQRIVSELGNEKIDIVIWSEDPVELIRNLLSPAKVMLIDFDDESQEAMVVVPDDQLSLAIGRGGQNVRLAAKICGHKIDIKGYSQLQAEEAKAQEDEELRIEDDMEAEINEAIDMDMSKQETVSENAENLSKEESDERLDKEAPTEDEAGEISE